MSNEVKETTNAAELLNSLTDLTPKKALSITSTLEEIGKWIQSSFKASAEDAWEKGRAFKLAKAKAKRNFGQWSRTWIPFLSERTIQRNMNVAELPKDDVKGLDVSEVYRLLQSDPKKEEGKSNKKEGDKKPDDNKEKAKVTTNEKAGTENPPPSKVPSVDEVKAVRLLEAIQTLQELTTTPGDWKDEIAANRDALKVVANKVLEILN